ncbi:uncharacterized protein LOC122306426 [Carya illinoinensis]|uniref:uncharacterized protein LOC122306426 n=1 Tax=Carya illinoinensis TaxID=32201 RepID=UPI001C71B352|nr:uncharacterized protein LOC122306426 [Carya illinoinensis]
MSQVSDSPVRPDVENCKIRTKPILSDFKIIQPVPDPTGSKQDRFSGLKSLVTFATIDVENVRILSDQGGDGTSEGAKVLLQSISKKQGKKMNFAESVWIFLVWWTHGYLHFLEAGYYFWM